MTVEGIFLRQVVESNENTNKASILTLHPNRKSTNTLSNL